MGLLKRGKIWYIRYWFRGKEKWESAGPSKRQAELALAKRRIQIREGKFFETPEGWKLPYGELLNRYLNYSKIAKKPTTYETDFHIAKPIRASFGGLLLRDITPQRVQGYLEEKLASGLSPSTVNYHLSILKNSLTMAVRWSLLRENPLAGMKIPGKIVNARSRLLLPEEITRLLSSCSLEWKEFVTVALNTGMRKNEILKLRKDQLDLERRFAFLPTSKNDDPRPVPLTREAIEIIKGAIARNGLLGLDSPYVFVNPSTGLPYRRDTDTGWRNALRRASLEDVHFHDLRHTAASYLAMAGVDLVTIAEILGHRDMRTLRRYTHITRQHKLQAVDKLAEALKDPRAKEGD